MKMVKKVVIILIGLVFSSCGIEHHELLMSYESEFVSGIGVDIDSLILENSYKEINQYEDSLVLTTLQKVNCCGKSIGDIELRDDSLFLLVKNISRSSCTSIEYHEFTYVIKKPDIDSLVVVWGNIIPIREKVRRDNVRLLVEKFIKEIKTKTIDEINYDEFFICDSFCTNKYINQKEISNLQLLNINSFNVNSIEIVNVEDTGPIVSRNDMIVEIKLNSMSSSTVEYWLIKDGKFKSIFCLMKGGEVIGWM
jgi:hypothetical protein